MHGKIHGTPKIMHQKFTAKFTTKFTHSKFTEKCTAKFTARGGARMHENTEQRYNNYTRVWVGRRDGPQIWVDQRGRAGPGSLPPTLAYHQYVDEGG